jgi:cell division protein FtsB
MTIEELQTKLESLENGQVKKEDIEALKAEIAKMTPEVKKDDIEKLDKALNDLNAKMEKLDKGTSKKMTFEEAIKEVFERPEVKAAIESKSFKDGLSLELKVATTDVTGGTASVSLIDNEKIFAVSRPLAFVGQLPTAQVGTNKNRVVWIEGAYTSNAGYVGEGVAQATADTATSVEKLRAMAKTDHR